MRPAFLQLCQDHHRRLVEDSEKLREEIRLQSLRTIAIIDRLTEILHDDQRRREKER